MMMEKFRDCIDAFFLRRNPEFFVKLHGNFFIIINYYDFFAAGFFLNFLARLSSSLCCLKKIQCCVCV